MENLEQARARKMAAEADLLELELMNKGRKPKSSDACACEVVGRLRGALVELNSAVEGAEAAGLQAKVDFSDTGKARAMLFVSPVSPL